MYRFENVFGRTLVVCLLFAAGAVVAGEYHDFDAVMKRLDTAAGSASAKLITIGKSADGKPLRVLQIGADENPAVFVGANIAGDRNSGTEAALDLIDRLLSKESEPLLASTTFYIAPALNPDAHDGMFRTPRMRGIGNGSSLDRDRDGLENEDGPNDLDGDGRITKMRIPDKAGSMQPDADDSRRMKKADRSEEERGGWRVVTEGQDDDGDGAYNEDGAGGLVPDKSFPHGFVYGDPEAGPWAGYTQESRVLMDFLFARRNIALAVVYGEANNLLAAPRGLGGGGDAGSLKFKVPKGIAEFMGLDPEKDYTLDEVWEVAQTMPFVQQNSITKEQMLQFLGAGPATKPDDDDLEVLAGFGKTYKTALEDAGLDHKRKAAQYRKGGLTPWLYYQYGVLALELDVWGVPKAEEKKEDGDEGLTLDAIEAMDAETFVALGEEKVAAFLVDIDAPPQFSAAMLIGRIESGEMTPEQLATMARRMGGGGDDKKKKGGPDDLMTFIDAHAPEAFTPWTAVTLPDGTEVEVGGVDPFVAIAPAMEILQPALVVHTDTILELAGSLPKVEIVEVEVESLGGDVFRVRATVANNGRLATHTKMARRARSHLPILLSLDPGKDASLVTGARMKSSDRLEGSGDTFSFEWTLHRQKTGAQVLVEVTTENAGSDRRMVTLEEAGS